MASRQNSLVLRQIQGLFSRGTLAGMGEGQLLERFAVQRDEAAFETIVARHGPMVLALCRRLLHDPHTVEDAFQATFLVLVSKAAGLRDRDALGPWLYGVAYRVAARTRSNDVRRRWREQPIGGVEGRVEAAKVALSGRRESELDELRAVLDQEINRLPDKLRLPLVLCHLEGRSYADAAAQLRWTVGTVRGRLVQARQRLRRRLLQHELAPRAGLPSLWAMLQPTSMVLPESLVQTTIATAARGALAVESAAVGALAASVARALFLARLKALALVPSSVGALIVSLVVGGVWLLAPGPAGPSNPAQAAPARSDSRITISGQTRTADGQPIAGATIQVINANRQRTSGADPVLGRTVSGPDGRFVLRGLTLPVVTAPPGPIPKPDEGKFEVAAWAPGFGFTWHALQSYRPGPRPVPAARPDTKAEPGAARVEPEGLIFYEGEPITTDLVLGPPARIQGRVVDDAGRPVAGARIQVGYTDDPLRPDGYGIWNCAALDPDGGEDHAFNGIYLLPAELRSTRTDADGRYVIDDLPRETKFLAMISYEREYEPLRNLIATSRRSVGSARSLGESGVLNHTFIATRKLLLEATLADTGRPAPGVTILARGPRTQQAGATAQTDLKGNAVLKLLPGEYTLRIEPAAGTDYVVTEQPLKVEKDSPEQAVGVAVHAAAVVVLEAVEAGSGAAIAGVGFASAPDENREPAEVQSQTVFVDHPTTGPAGRLRVALTPGRRQFFPGRMPAGVEPVTRASPLLGLEPGSTTTVRLEFKKKSAGVLKPTPGNDPIVARLLGQWQTGRDLAKRGRIKVRKTYVEGKDIDPDRLRALMDGFERGRVPQVVERIRAEFPDAPAPFLSVREVWVDEPRRRELTRFERADSGPSSQSLVVLNGQEEIQYHIGNAQVDLRYRGRGSALIVVDAIADYCFWPRTVVGNPVEHEGGRVTVERKVDDRVLSRLVVEEATGFVYRLSKRDKAGASLEELWQFAPRTLPQGLTIPGLSVEVRYRKGEISAIWVVIIDEVDLDAPITPDTFVVAVPAGTKLVDYRNAFEQKNAAKPMPVSVLREPVTDIVTRADRIDLQRPPIAPPIAVGQIAPAIEPAAWLNASGKSEAPALADKVVLVDFWGITCGPCVAQLPEVREAAEHFAGTDLVILGLHDSHGAVEEVRAFARKRSMAYPLAIDRPAGTGGGFGATFGAYGIHMIPHAVVIDRQGRVAYVGRFQAALEKAAALIKDRAQ